MVNILFIFGGNNKYPLKKNIINMNQTIHIQWLTFYLFLMVIKYQLKKNK